MAAAHVPEAFVWEAETEIDPEANTALEGLYMSRGMYCTQCEAQGFRKITYWPDRPDVMARFRVRIEGEAPVLLSNGNLVASGPGFAEWEDPFPKPSYLFALVAGDLVAVEDRFVTMSGREVLLQIWVRPGDEDRCGYAMDALKRSMRVGRGGLRARVRPRPLHDRRGRRLQHGGDGEQGAQRLQLEVRAGEPGDRDRRRLQVDRGDHRARVFPQLDRQPDHLPRLVPALAQGGADGLSRPAVLGRHALARRSSASRT